MPYPRMCFQTGRFGGGGRDRTADLRVMNPSLSPSELLRRKGCLNTRATKARWDWADGKNPRTRPNPDDTVGRIRGQTFADGFSAPGSGEDEPSPTARVNSPA